VAAEENKGEYKDDDKYEIIQNPEFKEKNRMIIEGEEEYKGQHRVIQ